MNECMAGQNEKHLLKLEGPSTHNQCKVLCGS